jgi:catechol 2,3-dioxygenase-like lactoylglutathione lyase family enzyme
MRFAHTNIIARDWQVLADFYCKVFACEIVPPVRDLKEPWLAQGSGIKDARLTGAHLRLPGYGKDGPTLEIFQYQDPIEPNTRAPQRFGFGHIAFQVKDVEEARKKALEHGGKVQGETVTVDIEGAGKITWVYVLDPEGNVVELQTWHD